MEESRCPKRPPVQRHQRCTHSNQNFVLCCVGCGPGFTHSCLHNPYIFHQSILIIQAIHIFSGSSIHHSPGTTRAPIHEGFFENGALHQIGEFLQYTQFCFAHSHFPFLPFIGQIA
ncbi:unnamed protein product [Hymenolepis diminuta]|nr:unnamed protein product [Hymenolepis diminuta]